jgi:hypothetical protein
MIGFKTQVGILLVLITLSIWAVDPVGYECGRTDETAEEQL